MNKNLIARSLLHALLAIVYIFAVALVMSNGDKIFGDVPDFLVAATFLTLFVLSAAVMGALVLGKPILLYWENKKKEGLLMFFGTLGWLTVFIFCGLLINYIF